MSIVFDQLRLGNIILLNVEPPGRPSYIEYNQVYEMAIENLLGIEQVVAKRFDFDRLCAYDGDVRYSLHLVKPVEFNEQWATKLFKGKLVEGENKIWRHENDSHIKLSKKGDYFYYQNKDTLPVQFQFLHSLQNLYYESIKEELIRCLPTE